MYAIIFWQDESRVKPVLNKDSTLTLFDTLSEADIHAERLENMSRQMGKPVEARVISIESVSD